jgi:hypothetical protein
VDRENGRFAVSKLVMGVGGVFILTALVVLVAPDLLVSAADWESRGGQLSAGAMRIVFGGIFALAAPSTRYPKGMRIFGGVLVVAGFVVVAIPNELWAGLISWWLVQNLPAYRFGGALVGVLLGSFLIHASRPERLSGNPDR